MTSDFEMAKQFSKFIGGYIILTETFITTRERHGVKRLVANYRVGRELVVISNGLFYDIVRLGPFTCYVN